MAAYLARRFSLMVLTLFGISIIVFVLLRLVPGNIADILFDSAGMINPADKKQIEQELGLDRPIAVQYAAWIGGLFEGDLGYSYKTDRPAIEEIAPRIPVTAKLAALALAFSVLFGVPLGVISAVRQNSALDYLLRVVSLSGLSMPSFWLGLLVLMAFVAAFGTIPIYTDPPKSLMDELLLLSVPAAAVVGPPPVGVPSRAPRPGRGGPAARRIPLGCCAAVSAPDAPNHRGLGRCAAHRGVIAPDLDPIAADRTVPAGQ